MVAEEPIVEKKSVQLNFTKVGQVFAKPFQCTVPPNRLADKTQWQRCWIKRVMVGFYLLLVLTFLALIVGIVIAMYSTNIPYETSGNMIIIAIPIGIVLIATLIGTIISALREQYAVLGLVINIILIIGSIFLIFNLIQGL